MNNKVLLGVGVALIAVGLFKPDLSSWININTDTNRPVTVIIEKPTNQDLEIMALKVIDAFKVGGSTRSADALRLAQLYNDLSVLISLSGENTVIKNTEEIRQANSLSGLMLRLNIKGEYPGLTEAAYNFLVTQIGDDIVPLDSNLRSKAVNTFKALAWACNEGSK